MAVEGNLESQAGFTYTLLCMTTRTPEGRRGKPPREELPLYCDYLCPRASFAPADATGACRREQGVYCSILGSFNAKNSRCKVRETPRVRQTAKARRQRGR
jgi:hypothetical protein